MRAHTGNFSLAAFRISARVGLSHGFEITVSPVLYPLKKAPINSSLQDQIDYRKTAAMSTLVR
jgi:hypothetical protein